MKIRCWKKTEEKRERTEGLMAEQQKAVAEMVVKHLRLLGALGMKGEPKADEGGKTGETLAEVARDTV